MMTLWLWDADGPHGSASGINADDSAAKIAARQGMITTGADTATVEQATHLAGGGWMRSGYSCTGVGWTARYNGKRVRWSRFHQSGRSAS